MLVVWADGRREKGRAMTTYTIELQYQTMDVDYVQLPARSDAEAVRQMEQYPRPENARAYLTFYRESDGQYGYINRDGASAVGKSW